MYQGYKRDYYFGCNMHDYNLFSLKFFSIANIISLAISLFVAPSIPSSPGEEFTSSNRGPLDDRMISTPATLRFIAFAALIAMRFSSTVGRITEAVPPR